MHRSPKCRRDGEGARSQGVSSGFTRRPTSRRNVRPERAALFDVGSADAARTTRALPRSAFRCLAGTRADALGRSRWHRDGVPRRANPTGFSKFGGVRRRVTKSAKRAARRSSTTTRTTRSNPRGARRRARERGASGGGSRGRPAARFTLLRDLGRLPERFQRRRHGLRDNPVYTAGEDATRVSCRCAGRGAHRVGHRAAGTVTPRRPRTPASADITPRYVVCPGRGTSPAGRGPPRFHRAREGGMTARSRLARLAALAARGPR